MNEINNILQKAILMYIGETCDPSKYNNANVALMAAKEKGSRNESAVIIADLYRVQNLLSSVLEGRPHVKEELQSSLLQPNSIARAAGSRS